MNKQPRIIDFQNTRNAFFQNSRTFFERINTQTLTLYHSTNGTSINNEVIDTLTLARDKFPGSPVSLDALCKRYRIDNSKRTLHTALIDCDLLAKVYINLIDQKEPMFDLNSDNIKKETDKFEKIMYYKDRKSVV